MDPRHKKVLTKNLPYLCKTLDPQSLLAYLHCLSPSSKEQIECRQNNVGRHAGVMKLHEFLTCSPKAWNQLMAALRDPDLELSHVADRLDPPTQIPEIKDRPPSPPSEPPQIPDIDISSKTYPSPCHVTPAAGKQQGSSRPVLGRDTTWNDLNTGVREILKQLDIYQGADKLAEALGLTIREYNTIRIHKAEDGVALALIEDWNCRQEITLGQLMTLLRDIERLDVLHDLERATGIKLLDEVNGEHKGHPSDNASELKESMSKESDQQTSFVSEISSLEEADSHRGHMGTHDVLPDKSHDSLDCMTKPQNKPRQDPGSSSFVSNYLQDQLSKSVNGPDNKSILDSMPGYLDGNQQDSAPGRYAQVLNPNCTHPGLPLFDRSLSTVDATEVLQPYVSEAASSGLDQRDLVSPCWREDRKLNNQQYETSASVPAQHQQTLSNPQHPGSTIWETLQSNDSIENSGVNDLRESLLSPIIPLHPESPYCGMFRNGKTPRVTLIRQESQAPGIPISPVGLSESTQALNVSMPISPVSLSQSTQVSNMPLSPAVSWSVPRIVPESSYPVTGVSERSQSDDRYGSTPWWEGQVASDHYTTDVMVHTIVEDRINNNSHSPDSTQPRPEVDPTSNVRPTSSQHYDLSGSNTETLVYPSASNCQSIRPFHQPVSLNSDVIDLNKTTLAHDEGFACVTQDLIVETENLETNTNSFSAGTNETTLTGWDDNHCETTSELSNILKKGLKPFPDVGPEYCEEDTENVESYNSVNSITDDDDDDDVQDSSNDNNETFDAGNTLVDSMPVTSRGASGLFPASTQLRLDVDPTSKTMLEPCFDAGPMSSRHSVLAGLDGSDRNTHTHEEVYCTEDNKDHYSIDQTVVTDETITTDNESLANESRGEMDNENFGIHDSANWNQNMSSIFFSWPHVLGGAVVGAFVFMSLKK